MRPIKILITAGPTREPIDPVRFISNNSTGAMGYAIAKACRKRKHKPTLIAGPTPLMPPDKIKTVSITTAGEMFKAIKDRFKTSDCIIMAAAVSDFRPEAYYAKKLKRQGPLRSLRLRRNQDILYWLGRKKAGRLLVGFCMETDSLVSSAEKKMAKKQLDLIVANKIGRGRKPFGTGKTDLLLLGPGKEKIKLKNITKGRAAAILLDKIEDLWYKRYPK